MNDGSVRDAQARPDGEAGSGAEMTAAIPAAAGDETEPGETAEPHVQVPGDRAPTSRRLERAPSERYKGIEYGQSGQRIQSWRGSPWHAVWGGVAAGLAGAAIFVVAAGGLSFDWGLVVLAVYVGWSVGETVNFGAGASLAHPTRRNLAVVLALLALTAGEAGTWAWARGQGGNLPILDHLWTTYGPLLVVQYIGAAAAAAWTAR